jgi:hypothetical protein
MDTIDRAVKRSSLAVAAALAAVLVSGGCSKKEAATPAAPPEAAVGQPGTQSARSAGPVSGPGTPTIQPGMAGVPKK